MLLTIAAVVLGIICFISFIWLVVAGFKQHILWGLGVLLVPFVWVLFPIMRWEQAKKPFLVYLVSSLALVVVFFKPMMAIIQESTDLATKVESGQITEQQAKQMMEQRMMQIFTGQDSTVVITDDDLLTPEEQRIETLREELRIKNEQAIESQAYAEEQAKKEAIKQEALTRVKVFKPIRLSEARNHQGKKLRVVSFEGVERQGFLLSAGYDRLILERKLAGGNFKFEVLNKDIKVLEVQEVELR